MFKTSIGHFKVTVSERGTQNVEYAFIPRPDRTIRERMIYEWERYLSFKDFPMDCDLYPLVLAKMGFYFEASDIITCCFCQKKWDLWNIRDIIPMHTIVCSVLKENYRNVPIHSSDITVRKPMKRQYDDVDGSYSQRRRAREEEWYKKGQTFKEANIEFFDDVPALPKVNSSFYYVVGGILLTNTCVLDSILVIIYLYIYNHDDFRMYLQTSENKTYRLLLNVYGMYTSHEFGKALLAVTKHAKFRDIDVKQSSLNFKGCDGDRFLCFLNDAVRIEVTLLSCTEKRCAAKCSSCNVPNIYVSEKFTAQSGYQLKDVVEEFVNESKSTLKRHMSGDCHGTHEFQENIKYPAILPINMYRGRLTANDLLLQTTLDLKGQRYTLGGCTLHKNMHYTSLVKHRQEYGWYDNVNGRLQPLRSLPNDNIVSVAYYFKSLS